MALADLVLEGLTLILVIALSAVLIGGLTYLSITVASANGARLVSMGTYIYIPGAVYLNGTLYVPMYNIGHYAVVVRQLFIRVGNTLISQTLNTTLAPGQYYVYTTTLNQRPTAVTVVASPTVEPRLKLEFSANVTKPGQVTLMPMGTNTGGNGLIEVVVNDPYGAGWEVAWSYADQSYSVSEFTSYTWFINPPYLPIQITFNAQVTQNPSGYACQIQPSQVTNTYGPGSVQVFNVTCTEFTGGVFLTLDPVIQYWVANWEYVVTWTGSTSGYIRGYANLFNSWMYGSNPSTPVWASNATLVSGGNNSLAVTTWFIPTDGPITINVEFKDLTAGFGCPNGNCPRAYAVPNPPITVYPLTNTTIQLVFTATELQAFSVSVSVSDPYGAGWSVTWSGVASGGQSGSSSDSWEVVSGGSGTVSFTAKITSTPSGYTSCTISPASTSVTLTNSNPTAFVSFTVTCSGGTQQPPPPPPPSQNYCVVNPSATDNVNGASGAHVWPSTAQEVPVGKSASFDWGIGTNQVGGEYFDHWVIELNGQLVGTSTYSGASYTFTCSEPGSYSLVGKAIYMPRYLKAGGGSTIDPPGNGTWSLSQVTTAYFEWSDPLFIDGSWSASTDPAGDSLTLSVTLTDFYSTEGNAPQLSASTTLTLQSPVGMACYMGGVSASGSVNSATASSWLPPITIQVTCYLTNGRST